MKLRQYKLEEVDSKAIKICWLDGNLRPGAKVTLRDIPGRYKVVERYDTEMSSEELDLNRNPVWYSV